MTAYGMRIVDWGSDVGPANRMERLGMRAAPTAAMRREPLVAPPAISFDHVVITRGDARIGPLSFSVAAGAMTAIRGGSEERRGGEECVSPCRTRWWPEHTKTETEVNYH